jgi:hypothetical protein
MNTHAEDPILPLRIAVRASPPMVFLEYKRGPNGAVFHHDVEFGPATLAATPLEEVVATLRKSYPDIYCAAVPTPSVSSVFRLVRSWERLKPPAIACS